MQTARINLLAALAVLFLATGLNQEAAAQAGIVVKAVTEAVELAAKKSGRILSPVAKAGMEKALCKAAMEYGDNVLLAAREGGVELLEAGAKYGDDVWQLCSKVPGSARCLALAPETLLPLAKRIGPDVLLLETKAPGLAARAVHNFGDDGIHALVKSGNPADMGRLIGYAERAESDHARKLLLNGYLERGSKFLNSIDWKIVMAGGLSTAMITAAYKTSDGIQTGLVEVARNKPEVFQKTVNDVISPVAAPVKIFLIALGCLLLYPLAVISWRLAARFRGPGRNTEKKDEKI